MFIGGRRRFSELSSDELLTHLDDLMVETTRLEATRLACMSEVDARNLASEDGHLGTAPWLTFRYGVCRQTVGSDLSLARKLLLMPATEQALQSGMITCHHARRLVRARTRRTEQQFDQDEQHLVDNALQLSFKEFCTAVRYWEQHADPDGSAQTTQKAIDDRKFSMGQVGDEWVIHGTSDLVAGTEISEALYRIEQELFKTDWAKAKERVGDDVSLADLDRTYTQRKHDALLEMARRATATDRGTKAPEPLVTIVMDYDTFMNEALRRVGFGFDEDLGSDNGRTGSCGEVPPPVSCFATSTAGALHHIHESPSASVGAGFCDVAKQEPNPAPAMAHTLTRNWWPETWRIPSQHAEMDHVIAVEHGGHTSEQNCRPKCPGHHRYKHSNRFNVYLDNEDKLHTERADGTPIQPIHGGPPHTPT